MNLRDCWETPEHVFNILCDEAGFMPVLDVAATVENSKCYSFCRDGLKEYWPQKWWCNPPYSNISEWVDKALKSDFAGIMLLPANRTGSKWWAKLIKSKRIALIFVEGRIRFEPPEGITPSSPSFDSVAVVVYPHSNPLWASSVSVKMKRNNSK